MHTIGFYAAINRKGLFLNISTQERSLKHTVLRKVLRDSHQTRSRAAPLWAHIREDRMGLGEVVREDSPNGNSFIFLKGLNVLLMHVTYKMS